MTETSKDWCVRPEEWLLVPMTLALVFVAIFLDEDATPWRELFFGVVDQASYGVGEFAHFWYFSLWLFGVGFVVSVLVRSRLFRSRWERWKVDQREGRGSAPAWLVNSLFRSSAAATPVRDWTPRGVVATAFSAIRDYLPFLLCLAIYSLLRDLVATIRPDVLFDAELRAIDLALFGCDPFVVVRHLFDRPIFRGWVEPFFVASYSSYIYAVPLLACLLYAVNDVRGFRHLMLSISLASFLGYVGYVLVPAVGPSDAFPAVYERSAGDALPAMVAMDAYRGALTRDAFPSLHTAWTLLFMAAAWRYRRWMFFVYIPFALGVFAAMFYYGKHYAIDVIAGALLAAFTWTSARRLG